MRENILNTSDIEQFIEDEKTEAVNFAIAENNYKWLAIWFLTAIILVSCICERQSKIDVLKSKMEVRK